MSAELIHITPINLIIKAIRQCYLSEGNSDSYYENGTDFWKSKFILGSKDKDLIKRIISSGHESTLEHSLLTFKIQISRGCLQELSRHRVGVSPSVQSTRYTLKKIINEDPKDIWKFIYKTDNEAVNILAWQTLRNLRILYNNNPEIPNDILKYGIPEALLIEEIISFNWRSFRHFLQLRLDKKAHFEIRQLAENMVQCIPEQYQLMMEDIYENTK